MTAIVSDNEFVQAAQSILGAATNLQITAERLTASIDVLVVSGIVSAATTAALNEKKVEIKAVSAGLSEAIRPLSEKTRAFINNIDEIDSFLY